MPSRWAMLAVVFLTRSSMGVQYQALASVAPLIVADLGIGYTQIGTLIGLYMLPGTLFALAGGLLGQRFGERRVVVLSMAAMAAGAVVTAASHGFAMAAAGRLISGIGAVLMNILLAKMVADWFAGREMATAMAVTLSSWPVGLALAAATLGGVGAASGWRTAVYLTAIVALIGLALMLALYRDPPRALRAAASLTSLRVLQRREAALAVIGGFSWGCFNASLVVLVAFGPGLLIAQGMALGEAGATVSTAVWITLVSVPIGGVIADRLKRPNVLIIGGSLAAGAVILLVPGSAWPLGTLLVIGLVAGLPPGAVMALLPKAVRPDVLTVAFGVYYAVFYLVMVAAQPIAGALRDAFASPAPPFVFAAALMFVTAAGLAIFRVVERRGQEVAV
jgi:MFS family permease